MSLSIQPVAYLKQDEANGNALDATGRGNGLTDNNTVTSTTGILNGARQYTNANTEFFSANSTSDWSVSTASDWSWSGWVYLDDYSTSRVIFSKLTFGDNSKWEWNWFVQTNGKIYLQLNTNTAGEGAAVSCSTVLSTGTWYHVVITYTAADQKGRVYLNTVLDGTTGAFSGTMGSGGKVALGGYENGSFTHDGRIDEVGMWQGLLNSTDISTLYGGGTPPAYETFADAFTADGTLETAGAALAGAATFDPPVFSATGELTTGGAALAGAGVTSGGSINVGAATLTTGGAALAGTAGQSPHLSYPSERNVPLGKSRTIVPTMTGGPATSFAEVAGAPNVLADCGGSLNASTGVITFPGGATPVGDYTVTIKATNATGDSNHVDITIHVIEGGAVGTASPDGLHYRPGIVQDGLEQDPQPRPWFTRRGIRSG